MPARLVHMPAKSFEKMKADLGEALASEFEALRFETHANVEIKNMGRVDTVSFGVSGERGVDRARLGGCHRATTTTAPWRRTSAFWPISSATPSGVPRSACTRLESHESHDARAKKEWVRGRRTLRRRLFGVGGRSASRRAEGDLQHGVARDKRRLSGFERLVGISPAKRPSVRGCRRGRARRRPRGRERMTSCSLHEQATKRNVAIYRVLLLAGYVL